MPHDGTHIIELGKADFLAGNELQRIADKAAALAPLRDAKRKLDTACHDFGQEQRQAGECSEHITDAIRERIQLGEGIVLSADAVAKQLRTLSMHRSGQLADLRRLYVEAAFDGCLDLELGDGIARAAALLQLEVLR